LDALRRLQLGFVEQQIARLNQTSRNTWSRQEKDELTQLLREKEQFKQLLMEKSTAT
jgi:hypothetical protein